MNIIGDQTEVRLRAELKTKNMIEESLNNGLSK